MKKYFFILAVVMAFVTGCNKNEDISPVSKNKTSPSSNSQPVRVLTDGMVDSIAMFHNLYLNTVVGDFDMNAPDELAELTSQFYTLGLISVGLDSNDVDFYLETIDHTNFIVEHSGNETVLQIMSDFQSFFLQAMKSAILNSR